MSERPPEAAPAETRRLAAIMFTDIVGFSRQMGSNEARTLRLLDTHNQLIQHTIAAHHGTVIKMVGDAFLVDFPSVVRAVQCAQHIHAQFRAHNVEKEQSEQIHVRIGIHLGDIVQREGDVFGDGVNIAARLQTLAEPDTICISDMVYRDVAQKLDLGTVVSLGRPRLKNIAARFQIYALLSELPQGVRQTLRVQGLKLRGRVGPVQRAAAAILLLALVSVGAIRLRDWYATPSPALPLPDKSSIVVLPFVNMSKDPEQEYFSDGLTEVLTGNLSKISSLFVIARNSAFTYKGKAVKVQDVGREMGVRYVVEGSVLKAEGQVRITAQLIDATTGYHLWSERYDRPLQDIFALQDEIVQQIVTTLKLQLSLQERGILVRKTTDNQKAYDYFLRGVEQFWRFTQEANAQARQMYEKAIELDPTYAQAYTALGWTYAMGRAQWSQDPQAPERVFELAQKAVALDNSLSNAHVLLGWAYAAKRQREQAIAEMERAIALDPNDAFGYAWLGFVLNFAGRPQEAIGMAEKAVRLDPRNPVFHLFVLGSAYHLTGQTEEAIATFKRALKANPDYLGSHLVLTIIYSELGREEEARAEATEVLRLNPNFSVEGVGIWVPYKDPAVLERVLAALHKAGLK